MQAAESTKAHAEQQLAWSLERLSGFSLEAFRVGLRISGEEHSARDCRCGLAVPGERPDPCGAVAAGDPLLALGPAAIRRCSLGVRTVLRRLGPTLAPPGTLTSGGFLTSEDAIPDAAAVAPVLGISPEAAAARLASLPRLSAHEAVLLERFVDTASTLLESCRALGPEEAEEARWIEEGAAASVVGLSPAIESLRGALPSLANSDLPLLLNSEPGNGRHLVAAAVHRLGPRRAGPFVVEHLGAIPSALQEGELFGLQGNGGGGLLALAAGGTLFLHGVEHLAPGCQARLLEALGPDAPDGRPPSVRLIAASDAPLGELVERGRFLPELLRRLGALQLRIAPLRERPEDVAPVAAHLLGRIARRRGAAPAELSPEAAEALKRYPWSGNVRELEQELERASADRHVIQVEDLDLRFFRTARPRRGARNDLRREVGALESDLIGRVLAETHWNKSQAARRLGLSRLGLQKKIDRYRLDRRRNPPQEAEAGT